MDEEDEAERLEGELRATTLRTRAGLGVALLAMGALGFVGIPALVLISPMDAKLAYFWGGALVALVVGWQILRYGLPDDEEATGAVPLRFVVRAIVPASVLVVIIAAWPLGFYRDAWTALRLSGTDCDALLPLRSIEALGAAPAEVAEIEVEEDRCAVELAPVHGSGDVASLRIEVTQSRNAHGLRPRMRRFTRRLEPVQGLGEAAFEARFRSGRVVGLHSHGRDVVVQVADAAWDARGYARLVAHLREASARLE